MKYVLLFCIIVGMGFSYPYQWQLETCDALEDTFVLYQYVQSYVTHFTADKDNDGYLEFYRVNPVWSEPIYIHIDGWRKAQENIIAVEHDELRLVNGDTLFIPIIKIRYRGREFRLKIDFEN